MSVATGVKAWVCAVLMVGALATMDAGAAEGAWDKAALQQMYVDFLAGEGYRPEVDGDGDVVFKKEGRTYYIMVDDRDPEFFRLAFPAIWQIDDEEERSRVLIAAEEANRNCKVAKTYIMGGNRVWVNTELFVAQPEDFKRVFTRALSSADYGATVFWNKIKELEPAAISPLPSN